jgi:uncharacterized protein YdaU (DUF1376 family)
MHYYKRNLGDYAKKAGRLSMLQHGAYTLLIDACYDREQFPTLDEAIDWTWASTDAEVEAVKFVLSKFFTLEGGVYVQKRIQEEITEYHKTAENNKRIAKQREEAKRRRTQAAHEACEKQHEACTKQHETPPNHKPLTTNQEPLTSKQKKEKDITPSAVAIAPKFDFGKALLEAGVTEDLAASWLRVRKEKKLVNTEQAFAAFMREVQNTQIPVGDVVLLCVERSWGGFNAEWILSKSPVPESVVSKRLAQLGKHGAATAENAEAWLAQQSGGAA